MTADSPYEVDMHDAERELPELVERVEAGEGMVLKRRDERVARLIPLSNDFNKERNIDWEGKIWLRPDIEQ